MDNRLACLLFGGEECQQWRFVPAVGILRIVQNREELKEFVLREWIILVTMTLSTRNRCSHPDFHRRVHSIDHRDVAKLFVLCAAFIICHRVAMKRCGHYLFVTCIRQHIARQLLDRELIKRHVVVDRPNDPVAPRPDRARRIICVACGIRIPRKVQPLTRPVFTEFRSLKQMLDKL